MVGEKKRRKIYRCPSHPVQVSTRVRHWGAARRFHFHWGSNGIYWNCIVPKPKEDSNKNTLSDGSYQVTSSSVPQQQMVEAPQTIGRVHCVCVKRSNGQFCLAKLQQASPSAKRHPNAMYWSCSKRTVSGIRLNVQNIYLLLPHNWHPFLFPIRLRRVTFSAWLAVKNLSFMIHGMILHHLISFFHPPPW